MGVIWHGLDAYEKELAALATNASTQAVPLLTNSAEQTAVELRSTYPVITGHLRDSVQVRVEDRPLAPVTIIENTAAYAVPFEYGRAQGPAGRVFVPIVARKVRELKQALGTMLMETFGATQVRDRDA